MYVLYMYIKDKRRQSEDRLDKMICSIILLTTSLISTTAKISTILKSLQTQQNSWND